MVSLSQFAYWLYRSEVLSAGAVALPPSITEAVDNNTLASSIGSSILSSSPPNSLPLTASFTSGAHMSASKLVPQTQKRARVCSVLSASHKIAAELFDNLCVSPPQAPDMWQPGKMYDPLFGVPAPLKAIERMLYNKFQSSQVKLSKFLIHKPNLY